MTKRSLLLLPLSPRGFARRGVSTSSRSRSALAAAAAAAVAALLAGCAKDPPPFNPRAIQQSELTAAVDAAPAQMHPLPTTLASPYVPTTENGNGQPSTRPSIPATGPALGSGDEPVVRMSLQEVIQRAVANNLDVKVQGYEPAVEGTRVTEAEARFDPTFFATGQYEDFNVPSGGFTSITENVTGTSEGVTGRVGVRQNLVTGGEAELRYQSRWVSTGGPVGPFGGGDDSYYVNELALQITQPLLRDFGTGVNQARIAVARNNQRITLLEFRQSLEEQLSEIEQLYWQTVQAQRDVQIAEELLEQTLRTAELLFKRKGQDVTRVQISQANASVETRRALLVRARARVRDLSDQLKQRMNDPEIPVASPTLLLPGVQPIEEPVHFDLADQMATALDNRPELGQQRLRIDSATIAQMVGKNNLLPQLNVVGAVGAVGADTDRGGFLDSAEEQADFSDISWSIGLQFEIPIGNRAARAAFRRTQLQRQQAITQYAALIDRVALDVKVAVREVQTTWETMVAARQAVYAAADALLAVQQREDAQEPLTPEFVDRKLNLQANLANTRSEAAQAVSQYNIALSALEQAKGTLLRYNNVLLEENTEGPFVTEEQLTR
jgi:outer membrane protein